MENNLQHRQFFHGTPSQLQPGDMIHPNYLSDSEAFNKEHPEHTDFVWMSNRLKDADWYARRRTQKKHTDPPGHVYEVEPTGLHAPADTLTPGKKSASTHVSLAPVKVIREVPHKERVHAPDRDR